MQQQNLNTNNMLIGPSLATGDWTPESACLDPNSRSSSYCPLIVVWDTGFIPSYTNNLYALTVEQ